LAVGKLLLHFAFHRNIERSRNDLLLSQQHCTLVETDSFTLFGMTFHKFSQLTTHYSQLTTHNSYLITTQRPNTKKDAQQTEHLYELNK
jgi:hypothetical protein